jgi:hypothetical protein
MTVKRLTETGGWVGGIAHHRSPNQNSGMAVPSGVLGVIMHTMVGNLAGTDSLFLNPASQVSAHFGIAQDGTIIQWVSVRGGIAWHVAAGNANWYGIEHADNRNPANPLTEAQINASAQLVEFLSRPSVGRFALQVSNSTGTEGYGTHSMGGAAWGGHACPGSARAAQRAEIVRRAKIIRQYGQYPAPPPPPPAPPKEIDMIMVQPANALVPAGTTWPGIFLLMGDGRMHHILAGANTPDGTRIGNVQCYSAAGVPGPVDITWDEYLALVALNP